MLSSNTSAVSGDTVYVEDVFSTYLTTGASANITVVNGIDLAVKGGMVWQKTRNSAGSNTLFDTVRGANYYLQSNATSAQGFSSNILPTFNSDGFVIGTDNNLTTSGTTGVNWTFRKQPKFFDVVTYTGNDTARSISHSLGSTPGCIIVKCTSSGGFDWVVYHRSNGATKWLKLNGTDAVATNSSYFPSDPTSTVFNLGAGGLVNSGGQTYVAYIFAHDAGGFGLTGTDNVISCGSFNGASAGSVTLGYEPQWILFKDASSTGSWAMYDTMRGDSVTSGNYLLANTSGAESSTTSYYPVPNATGFSWPSGMTAGNTIYIAIRRGPMKVPTDATKVFSVDTDRNAAKPGFTSDFPVDFATRLYRLGGGNMRNGSRLTGANHLESNTTTAEASDTEMTWDYMAGWGNDIGATSSIVSHMFRRAPGFFDVVCNTGGPSTYSHNLGVKPQLLIRKSRSGAADWWVYSETLTATKYLLLDDAGAAGTYSLVWSDTEPTASNFTVGSYAPVNTSGTTYVNYLFATCPGVSKVGSYTGNGSSQTLNCGFAGGARFVMIKRTDSTGDWYVWDTARGIIAGNDPHLSLNTTTAEVTTDDTIDTDSSGFIVNQLSATNVNVNTATYIFLAIA